MLRTVAIDVCPGDERTDLDITKVKQLEIQPGKLELENEMGQCPNLYKRKRDHKHQENDAEELENLVEVTKKSKINEIEEPKPRIVLTFRSEKPGLKSSNMKIVSTEEKHDDLSLRRSIRARGSDTTFDKTETHVEDVNEVIVSPKKGKSISQPVSESDEAMSDGSQQTPKRSTRHRCKEFSDNVLANAIARKEKMYEYISDNTSSAIPAQRLPRRAKPTKLLVNKAEQEGQHNVKMSIMNIAAKSPREKCIQTRRSTRRKSTDTHLSDDNLKMTSPVSTAPKRKRLLLKPSQNSEDEIQSRLEDDEQIADILEKDCHNVNENSQEREIRRLNKLKKKHLGRLGLQAVDIQKGLITELVNDGSTIDSTKTDAIVDHLNTQKEVLESVSTEIKEPVDQENGGEIEIDDGSEEILEEDTELLDEILTSFSEPDTSDEDFQCVVPPIQREETTGATRRSTRRDRTHSEPRGMLDNSTLSKDDSKEAPPRRSKRLKKGPNSSATNSEHSEVEEDVENNRSPRRRLGRKREYSNGEIEDDQIKDASDVEHDDNSEPAGGDEGSEPRSPEESARVLGTCYCQDPSNVYVDPSEVTEPMFCRAVELIDGVRVGCSHRAARLADGSLAPLRRAGPRSPYILVCALHTAQLRRHMCCPTCGLFCTHGVFYQCSKGHLFHLECTLPHGDSRPIPGCPHCGFYYNGQVENKRCEWVKLNLECSNRRILLPEQRVQCTPAYLTFSPLESDKSKQEPIVPEELLPDPPIDAKILFERTDTTAHMELSSSSLEKKLCQAIKNHTDVNQLVGLIKSVNINKAIEGSEGETYLHQAARAANLNAVHLLQYAGAALDRSDGSLKTPLMVAVLALLEKSTNKIKEASKKVVAECLDVDEEKDSDVESNEESKSERASKTAKKNVTNQDLERDQTLFKIIWYLVAAGCDVNYVGPDGMTALHMAAQHGSTEVCDALLSPHRVEIDPRDHGGWTPLVWAAENKHPAVVRLLLSRGADAAACDTEGNAVLHWCALAGDATSLKLLLDAAPPRALDALNAHGDTPLHVAARQGHHSCVTILLTRGAKTTIRNSSGELPVEVCSDDCRNTLTVRTQMDLAMNDGPSRQAIISRDISNGREYYAIACVNEVDDTPAPTDFIYVTRHVMPHRLNIDDTISTNQGCSCKGEECATGECACCTLGVKRWYTRDTPRLAYNFPYHEPPMLFECNQTCGCDLKKCSNAVVTRLSDRASMLVRAQVFRCGGSRGWGLQATGRVLRGTPVATYCGELLSITEADTRRRDHYMFSLDLKQDLLEQCEDKTQLCVDAAAYGSAARFINHSCRPNLVPVRVFTRYRDLRLPTVTLFAIRDIKPFEEFTFDYGDKFWSVKSKWVVCECGTPDCRYPTKTSDDTE